jgi:hypothetical protein
MRAKRRVWRAALISFAVGVSSLFGALATTFVPTSASAQHNTTRYGHYYHQGHYYPYRCHGHYYRHRGYYHHHYRYW